MSFSEALLQLRLGRSIKRRHWEGHVYWFIPEFVAFGGWEYPSDGLDGATLVHDVILATLDEGGYEPAQATQRDILSDDWEVVG